MIIEIEALDTLFFRDGKPFSMGDDTWANGMFPPQPGVLYGAIRSAYLGQNHLSLDDIEDKTQELRIKQIWYKIKATERNRRTSNSLYFPMPLDLVHEIDMEPLTKLYAEKYKSYDVNTLQPKPISFASHLLENNFSDTLKYSKDLDVENLETGLITNTSFENYLKATTKFEARQIDNHLETEPKIGISRNKQTRTTEDGNLYRVGMLRTDDIRILVEFENLELDKKGGILKLGAENKLAQYTYLEDELHQINLRTDQIDISFNDTFKICLTTPAIFNEGFYPTEIFDKAGVKVELITCAVGKYLNVGGFDMKMREPKVMQKAVPPGSVYYYRLISGSLSELEAKIKELSISEFREKEGFGIAFLAQVN